LIWFLILLYLLNNMDRTNVGFAALTMNRDLGLTAQSFGFAVGMFYVGYLFCEIPSNIILSIAGARRSLARLAIGSGLATMLTAFVQGPISFYFARFVLGVTEAGYLVGIVLYLTYWFPSAYRARLNALFMLSLPLAFTLSSGIAGLILELDGTLGQAGWQWLFILEGAPAVLAGLFALVYLCDSPHQATWLSDEERRSLEQSLAREGQPARKPHGIAALKEIPKLLRNPVVLISGAIYFALNFGLISLTTWMPTAIKSFGGLSNKEVGFVTMLAPLTAAVGMILWSRFSDLREERFVNTTCALLVGAAGWAIAGVAGNPVVVVIGFILAAIGVYATYAISFAIPQTYVAYENRPIAIATVGVIGNVGGVFVPMIVGALRTATGSFTSGFLLVAGVMTAAALITFAFRTNVIKASPPRQASMVLSK
jgi:ACS family tartrate transporter-like MFS transporter